MVVFGQTNVLNEQDRQFYYYIRNSEEMFVSRSNCFIRSPMGIFYGVVLIWVSVICMIGIR